MFVNFCPSDFSNSLKGYGANQKEPGRAIVPGSPHDAHDGVAVEEVERGMTIMIIIA